MTRPNYQSGFSIIEVMVALVISTLLLGGLVTTFTNANSSYAELTKASRQIENGRYAISVMETDLRHAGFWGEYTGSKLSRDPPPALIQPNPCGDEPAQFMADLIMPVYGYDGQADPPIGCLPNYKANTDVLVVRRAGTEPFAKAQLDPTKVYFQGYQDPPLGKGPYLDYGAAAPFDGVDAMGDVPIRTYTQHIYYIAKCHDCTGDGDGIPTLVRREYIGHQQFQDVPIAEGIEYLYFRYGVDNSGLSNGTPYQYLHAKDMQLDPDWDSVMAVEISLLARNSEETRDYQDTKSYMLGDTPIAADKAAYRRHAFTQVARVINQAARTEK